jgi:hypothetical protein
MIHPGSRSHQFDVVSVRPGTRAGGSRCTDAVIWLGSDPVGSDASATLRREAKA